jgi:hypothetical protein
MLKIKIWSYMKILFFLLIALIEVQPLLASAQTSPAQEALHSRSDQLSILFKISGLKDVLGNIESVVKLATNINEDALGPGQEEFARALMRQDYSSESFYRILRRSYVQDYKPRHVRSAVKWYQSALGKNFLRLENEANNLTNELEMQSFPIKLFDSPTNKVRLRLLGSIERSTYITEAVKKLFLEYVRLMHPFKKKADRKGFLKMLQALKKNITEPIREVVLNRMLFIYRDIDNKDLGKYVAFLSSPAGKWFHQNQLKGFKKGIKKAYYKAGLIRVELLKEIDFGGPDYPLLRNIVPPGQRYLLIGKRNPFRPLVNEKGLVHFSGVEQRRSIVRLFGHELKDIPPLALLVFAKIKYQHPKLYGELIKFQRLFNDRKALEKMEDKEYTATIKNYRNILERSADIKMELSPLQIEYDALRMTGVILKKTKALAMFEVKKTGYSVEKGDLVGPFFGTVEEVKDGRVIVNEKFMDYLGNTLKNQKIIQFSRAQLKQVKQKL